MVTHYNIMNVIWLKINDNGLATRLRHFLAPFRINKFEKDFIQLTLCHKKHQVPDIKDNQISGIYKGIFWKVAIEKNDSGEAKHIFFYSASFGFFLVVRIVLISYIKLALIKKGGFHILGSVFYYQKKPYFLFGRYGSGKTLLTLNALDKGARLVGDNVLLILPNNVIKSLFNEIELRYSTVIRTSFWNKLKSIHKFQLIIFNILSYISFRFISFNISLTPDELGIGKVSISSNQNIVFVYLSSQKQIKQMTSDETIDAILSYEKFIESIFGNIFSLHPENELAQLRQNIKSFLSNCSKWRLPMDCGIEEILSLS